MEPWCVVANQRFQEIGQSLEKQKNDIDLIVQAIKYYHPEVAQDATAPGPQPPQPPSAPEPACAPHQAYAAQPYLQPSYDPPSYDPTVPFSRTQSAQAEYKRNRCRWMDILLASRNAAFLNANPFNIYGAWPPYAIMMVDECLPKERNYGDKCRIPCHDYHMYDQFVHTAPYYPGNPAWA